jgi:N-formylglutamate amidohydrolase
MATLPDIAPPRVAPAPQPIEVRMPASPVAPVVFASPHSGAEYPAEFVRASRLGPTELRRSEDAFVDELFAAAPRLGAPLVRALFPRAYVDPNREAWELDPAMFAGPLPDYVNTASLRVRAGLGTIARFVATGAEIYREKLDFGEARRRIELMYAPYHRALAATLDQIVARFGRCLLIDCHSMPSIGGPMERDAGRRRVDFVLGDCHGSSAAPIVMDTIEIHLREAGFVVARNDPYAGGFTTRHYGRPAERRHAFQIEINRALYMDEQSITRRADFPRMVAAMTALQEAIIGLARRL